MILIQKNRKLPAGAAALLFSLSLIIGTCMRPVYADTVQSSAAQPQAMQTSSVESSDAQSSAAQTSDVQSQAAQTPAAQSSASGEGSLDNSPITLADGTVFDPVYYAMMNADVVRKYGTDPQKLLWHYINYGMAEGRFPTNPITEKDANGVTLAVTETTDGKKASANADAAEKKYKTIGTGTPYKILALGNSITKTAYTEIWWGYWGMGASSREKDYIHVLQSMIAADHETTVKLQNFSVWEQPESYGLTRTDILSQLNGLMTESRYDLIILELGENIVNAGDLKNDYQNFINYLQASQPDAQIVILGDFWDNKPVDQAEKAVCKSNKLSYIDVSDMRNSDFYVGMGAVVQGDDGKLHIVRNSGVAMHPNDTAMAVYASRIYEVLTNL